MTNLGELRIPAAMRPAAEQVNFLFDRSAEPYVTQDDLAGTFGLSKSTLGQKASRFATC